MKSSNTLGVKVSKSVKTTMIGCDVPWLEYHSMMSEYVLLAVLLRGPFTSTSGSESSAVS